MSNQNQFQPFATGDGALVMSPGAWQAFGDRLTGYPTGLLTKEALNTALRQACFVSASISAWVATNGTHDVLDNGAQADWETAFQSALAAYVKTQLNGTFIAYAGNPNGHVAGIAGTPGTQFPSVVWDISNNVWWVCAGTGDATHAYWVAAGGGTGNTPYWCGVATGTANAITVQPPAALTALTAGTVLSFQASATNTGATTLTATGLGGAYALLKPSGSGPIPLAGGEIATGNIITARFDGVRFQLADTALGTAALQNASSITGIVAAVSGAGGITPGHLAIFTDAQGTVADGGPAGVAAAPTVLTILDNNSILGPGVYIVDSRGGALTLKLPPAPTNGQSCQFIDMFGCWAFNPWTLAHNGNKILGFPEDLIANAAGEEFRVGYDTINATWVLE